VAGHYGAQSYVYWSFNPLLSLLIRVEEVEL